MDVLLRSILPEEIYPHFELISLYLKLYRRRWKSSGSNQHCSNIYNLSIAIDEKQIGEDMHTIISNRKTGRIALMVRSMRYSDFDRIYSGKKD
jgi:hypothetical protein